MSMERQPTVNLEVLTTDEVAELLRCSRQHIYVLHQRDGLPFTRLGRRTVVRAAELDTWLREHTERAS
jgi:excisionase family DNA binding protein